MTWRARFAATLALAACFVAPATAEEVYTATMIGANQNPPVTTNASGFGTFTLNDLENELTYVIDITGLDWAVPGFGDTLVNTPTDTNDDITGLHIHAGPAGADGDIVFGMFGPGHDVDFHSQAISADTIRFTGMWDAGDTLAQPLANHLANLRTENLYANAHTTRNPGGEIRGQLVAAPEPAAAVLLGAALAALCATTSTRCAPAPRAKSFAGPAQPSRTS